MIRGTATASGFRASSGMSATADRDPLSVGLLGVVASVAGLAHVAQADYRLGMILMNIII